MGESSTTLTAACHCKQFSHTFTVAAAFLPLKSHVCHCGSCRRVTGQLFGTFVIMPSELPIPDLSQLTAYKTSAELTRYSCPNCGCYIGDSEEKQFIFPVGVLDKTDGLLERTHIYVADTVDGGACQWFPQGRSAAKDLNPVRYLLGKEGEEATAAKIRDMIVKGNEDSKSTTKPTYLKARCHCGSISFVVSCRHIHEEGAVKEQPASKHLYPGFLDACPTCRLTSGMEITTWVRVPKSHLFYPPSETKRSPQDLSPYIPSTAPGLLRYSTSEPVDRYHCVKCGASIFYINKSLHDGLELDISAGIFDSPTGALAQEWVEWTQGPEFADLALDRGLAKALEVGTEGLRTEEEVTGKKSVWQ